MTKNNPLAQLVVLTAPDSTLRAHLESAGFKVISWPRLQIQPSETVVALDESIDNIYGYDWIIFVNPDSVHFFLNRFAQREHDVSELDALSVCAIEEVTATALEQAQVHVDLVATQRQASAVVGQLALFAGAAESLDRLNFLLPQATIGRDYLKDRLEETGARADIVATYQTVSRENLTGLVGLESMLRTGSVDAVLFSRPEEVAELARVFDRNCLGAMVSKTIVMAAGADTRDAALAAGISEPLSPGDPGPGAIIEFLAKHFDA